MRVYDSKLLRKLFIVLFGIFQILVYLTQSEFVNQNPSLKVHMKYYYLIVVIAVFIICISEILKNLRSVIWSVFIIIIEFLMFKYQSYSDFGVTLLAVYFAFLVDYRTIILTDMWSRLLSLTFILITFILGYTNNILDTRYGLRYSFGFINPNGLSIFILILSIELIWLLRKTTWKVLILLVTGYILYFVTKSRTDLYVMILVLPFIFKLNSAKPFVKSKFLIVLFTLLPVFLAFISIYLGMNYDPLNHPFEYDLNTLLSNRLNLARFYFNEYPVTLFGNSLTNLRAALDSGYVSLLIRGGIISTLVYLILVTLTLFKYLNVKNTVYKFYVLLLVMYSLVGVTEVTMYQSNLGLLLFAGIIGNFEIDDKNETDNKVRDEVVEEKKDVPVN